MCFSESPKFTWAALETKRLFSLVFFIRIVLGSLDMEKWSRHFFDEIGKKNPIILFPIDVDVERRLSWIFCKMRFHLWESWAKYIDERVPRSNCAEISSLKPRKYLANNTYFNIQRNFSLNYLMHGPQTPNEGINKRYLKNWANVADKMCFSRA